MTTNAEECLAAAKEALLQFHIRMGEMDSLFEFHDSVFIKNTRKYKMNLNRVEEILVTDHRSIVARRSKSLFANESHAISMINAYKHHIMQAIRRKSGSTNKPSLHGLSVTKQFIYHTRSPSRTKDRYPKIPPLPILNDLCLPPRYVFATKPIFDRIVLEVDFSAQIDELLMSTPPLIPSGTVYEYLALQAQITSTISPHSQNPDSERLQELRRIVHVSAALYAWDGVCNPQSLLLAAEHLQRFESYATPISPPLSSLSAMAAFTEGLSAHAAGLHHWATVFYLHAMLTDPSMLCAMVALRELVLQWPLLVPVPRPSTLAERIRCKISDASPHEKEAALATLVDLAPRYPIAAVLAGVCHAAAWGIVRNPTLARAYYCAALGLSSPSTHQDSSLSVLLGSDAESQTTSTASDPPAPFAEVVEPRTAPSYPDLVLPTLKDLGNGRSIPSAYYRLAFCFEFAQGAPYDPSLAQECYQVAVRGDHATAIYRYASFLDLNSSAGLKDPKVISLIEKAAALGNEEAIGTLSKPTLSSSPEMALLLRLRASYRGVANTLRL
eukprot:TRINITY_DN8478_c0_g1_i1.p1 TRINITY_DN8478_c0_g1~~TRINITY_DN8478_c0_g1_i1.p1  ORF type:complete len:555 (+),score=111.21 TRINITY_DN8478_c0_g1_i1:54-1718(+)